MLKIMHIVGARPNFMKIAPLMRVMAGRPGEIAQTLVHTGQHYDDNMSRIFFEELELPQPDVNLEVGSGSHASQTAQVMLRFEPLVAEQRPDWVVVVGDVNSTLACTLVCSKLGIRVAHVEAGLRSFDRTMPEELNRLVTDQLSDLLLTPSADGDENLRREGIPAEKIRRVGNIMIDTLVHLLPKAQERWAGLQGRFGVAAGGYTLVTLHRPSNVDDLATLGEIVGALAELAQETPVIFPLHPRTRSRLAQAGVETHLPGMQICEPLGYLDFLALQQKAALVLTDSGGIQEETTYLGVACLTARPNTERPVTITEGTNQLVASRRGAILSAARAVLGGQRRGGRIPELWDGRTAERITEILLRG